MDLNTDNDSPNPVFIQVQSCLIPGTRHRQTCAPCEDVVHIREHPDCCFFGLADGQTGKPYGARGGTACLQAAAGFVEQWGVSHLAEYLFPDELSCLLLKEMRSSLCSMARQQGAFTDYSSTLLAAAIDQNTGQYVLLHLGDGCIAGLRQDGTAALLSAPDTGISRYQTWLTTSAQAASHLRIHFGSVVGLKKILLLTDGGAPFYRGKNLTRQGRDLMNLSQEDLAKTLAALNCRDDIGCISLSFSCPGTMT